MIYGIDVSHWQGAIDWHKVASTGIKFAFLKATEGTDHKDDNYLTYLAGAKAAGILTSAYHYFLPKYNAAEQAHHFLDTVERAEKSVGSQHDLPLVIDVEVKASAHYLKEVIDFFLVVVQQARKGTPIIYTSPGFWRSYLGRSWEECVKYPLWVAHYGTGIPGQFFPWVSWKFWQYTRAGRIPGIAANVDLNVFSDGFYDLVNFCVPDDPPKKTPIHSKGIKIGEKKRSKK